MIHFTFSDTDTRYLFLKADFTQDELIHHIDKKTKKEYYRHTFDDLIDHINLVDPVCYLKTWSGPPLLKILFGNTNSLLVTL